MTDTEIRVTDQTSGEYVRTYERSVNATAVNMQAVVSMRAGIQNWLTLYAQHLGDETITLPDGSTTTKYILTRRPMPSDLEGVEDEAEDTGNTRHLVNSTTRERGHQYSSYLVFLLTKNRFALSPGLRG